MRFLDLFIVVSQNVLTGTASSKVLFHLNEMTGTWISAEIQKAV
jgi:hypothetical protein